MGSAWWRRGRTNGALKWILIQLDGKNAKKQHPGLKDRVYALCTIRRCTGLRLQQ